MRPFRFYINWLRWCWKLREWAPLSVGYVNPSGAITAQDISAAERFLKEHPELRERGAVRDSGGSK